mmetsp:Transcript_27736/g.46627  ORF Transcript_27736/g.46627 Transcript_27736/m.46627 type:complete len:180 (-) Transcript_27736:271-810(-)
MGKKSKLNKKISKSYALSLTKDRKPKTVATRVTKDVKEPRLGRFGINREREDINHEFLSLQERSAAARQSLTGRKRKVPVLNVAAPIFRAPLPTANIQASDTGHLPEKKISVDELIEGEEVYDSMAEKGSAIVNSSRNAANRYGHLDNMELLEDGTYDFLKLNVKEPTFSLPRRKEDLS